MGQMPRSLLGGKNLRRRKYHLQSSGEQTLAAAVEPFNQQRKLVKSSKQCSSLGAKQSHMKRHMHLVDSKDKTSVAAEDANSLSTFSAEKLKQSSESHNISEVVKPNGRRRSVRTRSSKNHALSHKFASAGDAVVTSVTDSLSSLDQPVVTLCRVESQPVNSSDKSIPADINSSASTENIGTENNGDNDGSLGSTRRILSYQLALDSELYGNTSNKVMKTKVIVENLL